MSSEGPPSDAPLSIWQVFVGWFIDNRLIALVATLVLLAAGAYVSPFDVDTGKLARNPVPVDAIPDIGENQQIVFTSWPGRSPRDIEDQVSYPLTTALLGIPGVRTVRSSSAFGFSTIYVIFEDDVEFYWSRSRLLEKLAALPPGTVPDGVIPTLGPDATALGQIFWYTLEGRDPEGNTVGGWDPDELRSVQDWTVRYALQSVRGVSEVASIGGFVREYQVDVDPDAMRAHDVSLAQVAEAVRGSNLDVGARTLEINGVEYLVRGLGFIKSLDDLEASVVVARANTPIRIRDVARVSLGPALRRGALDDEGAPAVGGVVVARFMENPLAVIDAVKEKIAQIQAGLPRRTLEDGTQSQVTIVPFYDRTTLIQETLGTLSTALFQQILITVIVVLIMLRNLRSSLLIASMLPLGVMAAFVAMKVFGVDANIMALAGIAIAIGTMVDIGIVFVENMNQHLARLDQHDGPPGGRSRAIRDATAEVAPAVMTAVLTTVVSFLPVFGLSSTELRLFAPLAYTKTFAMTGMLVLALIVLPGLSLFVLRRRPQSIGVVSPATAPTATVPADVGTQRAIGVTTAEASEPAGTQVDAEPSAGSSPPGPSLGRWPANLLVRSLFRVEHLRDWILFALSLALMTVYLGAGLFVLFLAVFRLLRPLLGLQTTRTLTHVENALAIFGTGFALSQSWSPLGTSQGVLANGLFVGGIIALLMGGFTLFSNAYSSLLGFALRRKFMFLSLPVAITVLGFTAGLGFDRLFGWLPALIKESPPVAAISRSLPGFGREYMPPFDEGSFLYMPSTMPHASIGEALDMLSEVDAAIAALPEVDRVVGKLGRADSALDPAPIAMIETIINYKPEYRTEPDGTRVRQWRAHVRTPNDIWNEIVGAAQRPGLTSAPTLMPINARIVMLQSGMRAPMGIKVHGPTLQSIEEFGLALEAILGSVDELRAETVFADRVVGKPYLEIDLDREAVGRYGLSIVDVQAVLQLALGGTTLTRTVEGRERYPVRVRYMREERDSIEALAHIYVPTPSGEQIPLSQLAEIKYVKGPQVIKSEDTFLTSYVLFDKQAGVAELTAVEAAQSAIREAIQDGRLSVPPGVSYEFAGSYQNQIRSEQRLLLLVPLALALVFILLYLQFHRALVSVIIYSGVAVSVAGGFLLIWLYGQNWFLDFSFLGASMRELFQVGTVNLSVAVWIGFIALVGIATDDGVVMATYLKQRFEQAPPSNRDEARERTVEAAARRVRPCLMTTATTILALLPVISSQGRGADMMVPMALPSVGGMVIELVTLFIVPVLFCGAEEWRLGRKLGGR